MPIYRTYVIPSLSLQSTIAMATDGRLQAFWYVTVLMVAPGLMATAIFTFLGAWKEYIFASLLTSTPDAQTTTVLIAGQISVD